jgi:hypothetical protein
MQKGKNAPANLPQELTPGRSLARRQSRLARRDDKAVAPLPRVASAQLSGQTLGGRWRNGATTRTAPYIGSDV